LLRDEFETPLGPAFALTDEAQILRAFEWLDCEHRVSGWLAKRYAEVPGTMGAGPARARFDNYFAGDLGAFGGLAWAAPGTAFQQQVWTALCTVGAGETLSYGGLAERIARPTAVRAVGLANGSNPIAVVVPCHRVIGADGTLTGYGGGLHRKLWLLEHEGVRQHAAQHC
jgi:methylated-DNA-[protein]-cysteine S-methyltransferase